MTETAARRNRPYAPRLVPEQRREQLLDLVLEIVDSDGVAGVSMDAVARRAGVTRPVVYSHFTDTNHMLRSSLDREGSERWPRSPMPCRATVTRTMPPRFTTCSTPTCAPWP